MNEEVDKLLQRGLELYQDYFSQGKKEKASLVLRITSMMALRLLDTSEYHKVVCPNCKKQLTDGLDIESVRQSGECLTCDHIRGNYLADQRAETEEEIYG